MKLILTGIALAFSLNVFGQTKPIKVVFDVTSKDSLIHQATVRHVKAMSAAYPDSEFEVVIYGGAVSMLHKNKSTVSNEINSFSKNDKVSFKVCEQSMKRHNVDNASLLTGVEVVPDGILEIVTKQGEGWGYIKETN